MEDIDDAFNNVKKIDVEESKPKNDKLKQFDFSEKIEDDKFNDAEQKKVTSDFLKNQLSRYNLRRKEKKMIENREYDANTGYLRELTIGLAVVGIIIVFIMRTMFPNNAMYALLIIIGATSFLPIGMIMGWMLFDPVMRCKILRKMTKRNYGVIHFVGHGTKMFLKIKNFDHSLIWRNNECWVMAKSRIYQMSKDGNAINEGKQIDDSKIITTVDTVPVMFVDTLSMEPLALHGDKRDAVYPEELGSSLKAWVDNQRQKMMAVKKMEDTILLIIAICAVGAVIISFITYQKVEEMQGSFDSLKAQLTNAIEQLTEVP